jgi:hypothetical protein
LWKLRNFHNVENVVTKGKNMESKKLYEYLCPNGHVLSRDGDIFYVDENKDNCRHCSKPFKFYCVTDTTNGFSENNVKSHRGFLELIGFDEVTEKDHRGNVQYRKIWKYTHVNGSGKNLWRVINSKDHPSL